MSRRPLPPVVHTVVTLLLWGVALPAVLARDRSGSFEVVWRGPAWVIAGVLLAGIGAFLLHLPARQLTRAGVGVFGVVPGPALVTSGWYRRVRNPMDIGATLVAVGAWAALAVPLMWVVPAAAAVNFGVGVGLYEDRRLVEEFGDEFAEYRRRVRKWIPRLS
jgi:protein-S-isoprenylcysteine O-methyltransferase Ste14